MRYNIDYSPESIAALNQIAEYLAERSAIAPFSVIGSIRETIESIGDMPRIGQVVEKRPRLRQFVEDKYKYWVYYEIIEDKQLVRIAEVIHSSREKEPILDKYLAENRLELELEEEDEYER